MPYNDYNEAIAPIIQAMLATSQRAQQQKSLEETTRSNKADEALRKTAEQRNRDQLSQLVKAHEDDVEHQKALLDLQNKTYHLQLDKNALDRRLQIGEAVQKGIIKPQNIPGSIGLQHVPGIEGTYSAGQFEGPEDVLKREFQKIEEAKSADQKRLEAGKEADYKRTVALANINNAGENARNLLTNQVSRENSIRLANARLHAAAAGQNVDESVLGSYANNLFVNGTTPETAIPQKVRPALYKAYAGFTPLSKNDVSSLDSIKEMEAVLEDARALLDETQGIGGNLKTKIPGTEANNLSNRIEGRLGVLARGIGKEKGVLTQQDVLRAKKLLFNVFNGDETNKKNVDDLDNFFTGKIQSSLQKYNPKQAEAIVAARGLDPKYLPTGKGAAPLDPANFEDPNTEIKLDNGTKVPNTRANRLKYGLEK